MTPTHKKSKLALRLLARCEGSAWAALPTTKGLALIAGRAAEPLWVDQRVEIVFAHLRTDTTPQSLSHAVSSVWKFDEFGMVDDEEAMREILLELDAPPTQWGKDVAPQFGDADLAEICVLLGVQTPGRSG